MSGSSVPLRPLLTPRQVATLFNVQRSTVYTWAAQGRLPTIRLNGRLRFQPESLESLLKRGRTEIRL